MKDFFRTILYQPLLNIFILLLSFIPGHHLWIATIALTILVRLALWPLRHSALESQMKQRELQPELKAIQEKYKDDRQAQSLQTMQLYKDKGINPASGCLPMLIQLPILIVLYYVFRYGLNSGADMLYSFVTMPSPINTAFLWVKDLTKPDPILILPILAGVAQFFYTRSLMASQPPVPIAETTKKDAASPDMTQIINKQMLFLAPIMTILIGVRFPAVLSLYWAFGSLIDWLQQMMIMKRYQNKKASQGKSGKVTVSIRKKNKATP